MKNTKKIERVQTDRLGRKGPHPETWSWQFVDHYCETAEKVGGWIIEGSREGYYPRLGSFVRQMFYPYKEKIDVDKFRELCRELDERWDDLIISEEDE